MKSKNYINHQSLKQGLIYNKFSSVSKQILFEHSYEDYFTESAHRGKKMKSDKGSRLVQFKIQLLFPRINEDRSQERRSGIQVISRILVSRVHIRDEKREKFNSYLLSVQSVLIDDTDSPLLTFVSRVSRWPRLRRLKSNHIFFVRNSIEDNSANYLCISDNQLNGKYLLYIRVVKNIYIFLIQRSNDSRWFFFFFFTIHTIEKKNKNANTYIETIRNKLFRIYIIYKVSHSICLFISSIREITLIRVNNNPSFTNHSRNLLIHRITKE